MEHLLVDVQPDTDDAVLDAVALKTVLNQDAGNLLALDVDVVGPFDFHLIIYIVLQRLAEGYADPLADGELARGRQRLRGVAADEYLGGVEQERERQVLAAFRLPGVGAAAAACRLVVGHDGNGGRGAIGDRGDGDIADFADIGAEPRCTVIGGRLLAVAQPAVRAVRLVDMDDFPVHDAKIQKIFRIFAAWNRKIRMKSICARPS